MKSKSESFEYYIPFKPFFGSFLVWLALLLSGLTLSQASLQGSAIDEQDPNPLLSSLGGILTATVFHESFHGVTAWSLGWRVESFRPFPHFCGGKFVGGCVVSRPPRRISKSTLKSDSTLIAAAGSVGNGLLGAILATRLPEVSSPGDRAFLKETTWFMIFDFPIYAAVDAVTDFDGDWAKVSRNLGFEKGWLIPFGALYVALVYPIWYGPRQKAESNAREEATENSASVRLPLLLPPVFSFAKSMRLGTWMEPDTVGSLQGVMVSFGRGI